MIYFLELENAFMLEEFRIIRQKEIRGMKGNRFMMQLSALAFVSAIFFEKSFLHTKFLLTSLQSFIMLLVGSGHQNHF